MSDKNLAAQFPGITNLLELFAVLEQCWSVVFKSGMEVKFRRI